MTYVGFFSQLTLTVAEIKSIHTPMGADAQCYACSHARSFSRDNVALNPYNTC